MTTATTSCKRRAARALGALCLAALAPALASTTPWQDTAAVRATAEGVVGARLADSAGRVAVQAEPLDPRLRVPACDADLVGELPPVTRESGRVTAEVRCPGSRPWRLYVPVRVSVTKTLLVAAVPLERGKILAASDVILAEREVGALPGGYLTAPEAAVGRVVRRAIPAGAAVAPGSLEIPVLVRRGQPVTLEARSGAIVVQMAGVARADGALGEMIAVENINSRKVLQGVVRNEKSVEIRVP
jgi:flagella basal body P-ring formation protein FlgA